MPHSKKTLTRLKRIEGQVRGVARMLEEDRYCIDVLHQVQAVKAALSRVEDAIMADHVDTCVKSAIAAGNADDQRAKFDELVTLFGKVKR